MCEQLGSMAEQQRSCDQLGCIAEQERQLRPGKTKFCDQLPFETCDGIFPKIPFKLLKETLPVLPTKKKRMMLFYPVCLPRKAIHLNQNIFDKL